MALPELNPAGYRYRPLKSGDRGWDVYALQSALVALGFPVGPNDGIWGSKTEVAVRAFQERYDLKVDGVAGVVTQRAAALALIWPAQRTHRLPSGLMRGQIEKESGFILGNHSPAYERNGQRHYDVGVTQRSTQYVSYETGYSAASSIDKLGETVRGNYNKYKAYGKITNERRLWELAAGSWNAPSWTDTLAKGGTLSPANRDHIEAYIDRVTVYLTI